MGQFEARRGPFGAFVSPVLAWLEAEETIGPAETEAEAAFALVDFGAFYRAGEWGLGDGSGTRFPSVVVEPYVGGRFVSLNGEVNVPRIGEREQDKAWADPIVGVLSRWTLTDRWSVRLQADIGGFGIASDLTWQTLGAITYRFGLFSERDADIVVGYRAVGVDHETGSGRDEFALDAIFHGPILGFSVEF